MLVSNINAGIFFFFSPCPVPYITSSIKQGPHGLEKLNISLNQGQSLWEQRKGKSTLTYSPLSSVIPVFQNDKDKSKAAQKQKEKT